MSVEKGEVYTFLKNCRLVSPGNPRSPILVSVRDNMKVKEVRANGDVLIYMNGMDTIWDSGKIDDLVSEGFIELSEPAMLTKHSIAEPINNGTREICYWCNRHTDPLEFSMRKRVCKHCKK